MPLRLGLVTPDPVPDRPATPEGTPDHGRDRQRQDQDLTVAAAIGIPNTLFLSYKLGSIFDDDKIYRILKTFRDINSFILTTVIFLLGNVYIYKVKLSLWMLGFAQQNHPIFKI